jgi:1,4-dihydroxy-2-naphthoate octaprenyltransferase
VKGYYVLLVLVYGSVLAGSVAGLMPWLTLGVLLSLPLGVRVASILTARFSDPKGMVPAMASNIAVHLLVGLLLCAGYVVSSFVSW